MRRWSPIRRPCPPDRRKRFGTRSRHVLPRGMPTLPQDHLGRLRRAHRRCQARRAAGSVVHLQRARHRAPLSPLGTGLSGHRQPLEQQRQERALASSSATASARSAWRAKTVPPSRNSVTRSRRPWVDVGRRHAGVGRARRGRRPPDRRRPSFGAIARYARRWRRAQFGIEERKSSLRRTPLTSRAIERRVARSCGARSDIDTTSSTRSPDSHGGVRRRHRIRDSAT